MNSKKIKIVTIALITAVVTTTGGMAFAKDRGKNPQKFEERMEKRLEHMTKELELSPEQQEKVRAIFDAKRGKMEQLRQDESLTKEERRERFHEGRKATREEIEKVLTPEQRVKAKEMRKNRPHHGKHKGMRLKRLAKKLDLTEAQRQQVKTLMTDARAERDTILEAHDGDRAEAKPELKAHRKATKAKIRAVLTPEQAAKFDAMKAKHKGKRGKGKRE